MTAAEQRVEDFNVQGLADAAWALAPVDQSDEVWLFAVLARVAQQRVGDFIPQSLDNTAWVFSVSDFLSDCCENTVWSGTGAHT